MSSNNLLETTMKFVSLDSVARTMTKTPSDMADVLRSPNFSDADKAAFADFIYTTKAAKAVAGVQS